MIQLLKGREAEKFKGDLRDIFSASIAGWFERE
jgi:hypothetical protein